MLSYTDNTSPIHRGVFLSRNILGNVLQPPADAIAPLSDDIYPDLTTRERVTLQTKSTTCQTCHAMINPLGFALEEYDAIGRLRTTENRAGQAKPINANGNYQPRNGTEAVFHGGHELGHYLATERDGETFVHSFSTLSLDILRKLGKQHYWTTNRPFYFENYSIRNLIVEIALVMTKPTKKTLQH